MEPLRSYAQVLQGDVDNRPLPVPRLPQAAENGTQVNIAVNSWRQSLARGALREEYECQFPLLGSRPDPNLRNSTTMKDSRRNMTAASVSARGLLRRRDSIIAPPTSEPGSPVVNDFILVDQIHRKKPYSPSMENEFASPPRKTRRQPRRDEEEPARKDGRRDTPSKSPSKKVGYNADRDTKEYMAARSLSGQQ
ncbi:hypothetical protein MBLNU13_g06478t1 [Cladosporium sp. NU13]